MIILLANGVILTLLTSSCLYVVYTQRVISNVLINGAIRAQIAGKIKQGGNLANGSHAKGLTGIEYQLVARLAGFPSLPPTDQSATPVGSIRRVTYTESLQ